MGKKSPTYVKCPAKVKLKIHTRTHRHTPTHAAGKLILSKQHSIWK